MRILCPIMNVNDIDILDPMVYGTEFFCGYLPQWWINKYNNSKAYQLIGNLSTPINNRNGASSNILRYDELELVVKKGKEKNTKVFLVLNAKYYPDYVYPDLKHYIEEVYKAGIREMIVCDLGMIAFLEENFLDIKVSLSCLNQITNSRTVEFYMKFSNVERIVFPRHMSSIEIKQIAKKFPEIEFEYFIFSNKCLYDDGYCRGVHEFTPICKDLYFSEYYSKSGKNLSESVLDKFYQNENDFRKWTRNEKLVEEKGYCTASFGCTACSLVELYNVDNIVSVKMSIRGHGVEERLHQVKMAKAAIDIADNGNIAEIKKIISCMYGKNNLCESGMACIMK